MKKKLLSLCLTLLMMLTLMVPSLAVPDDNQMPSLSGSSEYVEIPQLHTGGILADGAELEEEPEIPLFASTVYSAKSQADAAKYIRQEIKSFTDTIRVSIPTSAISADDRFHFVEDTYYLAFEHTGDPAEGDYLRLNTNGFSCNFSVNSGGRVSYEIMPNYLQTPEQEALVSSKVDQLMDMFGFTSSTTDYEKVRAINDYLAQNIVYTSKDTDLPEVHTTYSALIEKDTVCQGYASSFYRLALASGLKARCVIGVGNGGDHGWNIVCVDGKWYYTDPTWDAESFQKGYAYPFFLRGSKSGEFPNHTPNVKSDGTAVKYPPEELSLVSTNSYVHPLTIVSQPQDLYVKVGENKSTGVYAIGNGNLSFEWHYTLPGGQQGVITDYATISSGTITEENRSVMNGTKFYCIITDSAGKQVITDTVTLHVVDSGASLAGYTLSFDGDIAVNFYMELSDAVINANTAYMHFTIPGETVKQKDVPLSQAKANTFTVNGEKVTYYKFTAGVAAKDMTQDIHAEFYLAPGNKVIDTKYKVKYYADYIQNNPANYSASAIAMVQAMLNYGGYAQKNFNYHTNEPANIDLADISLPNVKLGSTYAYSKSGSVTGVSYKGSKLVLRTNTLIWHYLQITSGSLSDYTFKVDGKTVTPTSASSMGDGWYKVEIGGVPASSLDHFYKLEVTRKNTGENLTVNYCVYSNIKSITDAPSGYTNASVDMMKALYVYGEKTKAYFGK